MCHHFKFKGSAMNISIRNACLEDIEALTALLGQLFSIEADFTVDEKCQRRGVKLMLDGCGKHRCIKVAEVDNQVVGMCTIQVLISTAEGGMVGLLEDMVVDSRYRGRGIGHMLMEHVEAWARQHGLTRLQLLADRTNFEALDFYSKTSWDHTNLICLRLKV